MSKQFRTARGLTQIFIGLAVATAAFGQGLGTIVGTVTDSSGGVVPAAKVKITDEATQAVRETETNSQGYYVVPSLRPSSYQVSITASGFAESTHKGIVLQADQSLTVNDTLSVAQAAQAVQVEANATQVNTTTATNSEVVDQQRVVELPLNGRNAASLLTIVAGAIPSPVKTSIKATPRRFRRW